MRDTATPSLLLPLLENLKDSNQNVVEAACGRAQEPVCIGRISLYFQRLQDACYGGESCLKLTRSWPHAQPPTAGPVCFLQLSILSHP